MPQSTFGSTTFTWPDAWGQGQRIKIATAEGATISVPDMDLLSFLAGAYVLPMRQMRDGNKTIEQILIG